MVSDQEPRYRLVDDEGNIVGSLYGKADGSVAIQETDSGSDREVTLAPDGTFSAPSVETESVSTESLVIGGTLYEEDDNSPINESNVLSASINLNEPANEVIIIPQRDEVFGFEDIQVNGDTGTNYTNYDTSDTATSGEDAFSIGGGGITAAKSISIYDIADGNRIGYYAEIPRSTSTKYRGENSNISGVISSLTFISSTERDIRARVYRRVMDI